MADIQAMLGKEVEVVANGMRYSGILIEVSDEEVSLKNPNQWLSLPVSSVNSIKLKIKPAPPAAAQASDAEKTD